MVLCCVILSSAKPISVDGNATVSQPNNLMVRTQNDGSWSYGYKTSNNIEVHHESADNNDIQRGEYSYIDPDGRLIQVIWMAGAGIGFVPQSNVIDDAIVQSIELNLQNPPEGYGQDGQDQEKPEPKPIPSLNKVRFNKPEHKKVERPVLVKKTIDRKGGRRVEPEQVEEKIEPKIEETPQEAVETLEEEIPEEISEPAEESQNEEVFLETPVEETE